MTLSHCKENMYSECDSPCVKYHRSPRRKAGCRSPPKKTANKKSPPKKTTNKKSPPKTTANKKSPSKKTANKRSPSKKPTSKSDKNSPNFQGVKKKSELLPVTITFNSDSPWHEEVLSTDLIHDTIRTFQTSVGVAIAFDENDKSIDKSMRWEDLKLRGVRLPLFVYIDTDL